MHDTAPGIEVTGIGRSREDHPILALTVGHGDVTITVKGNAHADEPAGTATCLLIARLLAEHPAWRLLADRARFCLIPTANPDGLARNQGWLVPPFDLRRYFLHVYRDLPRDDVEFGYPSGDDRAGRPENLACARFFESCSPIAAHLSLHSMVFTGGAWFLIAAADIAPFAPALAFLTDACDWEGLPLHDEDRRGQRGFARLRPGFHTIPTVEGMRAFYERSGDAALVRQFRLNSMQYALSRCGARFAAVSELPLAYDPVLADMTPADQTRVEIERQRITEQSESLDELDAIVDRLAGVSLSDEGQSWLAYYRGYLSYRRSGLRSLADDLDRYADRPALGRDLHDVALARLRDRVFNAAAGVRLLHSSQDDHLRRRQTTYRQEFDARFDEMMSRFHFRPLPLRDQVRLQAATILAGFLAGH
ncbi:MAG: hypothetical protein HY710_16185 [Candidatus Latescibacteria bacterium]|nr:hypothetical protein [Candidatus Latescibacterota bacterium]